MYNVSNAFKSAIKSPSREFHFKLNITPAAGDPITLTEKDIVQGSASFSDGVMNGDNYLPGAAVSKDFTVTLISNDVIKNIDFLTATLEPLVGLVLPDDTVEYVPMGKFYVYEPSDVTKSAGFINIKANDAMLRLDKDISVAKLSKGVVQYCVEAICEACGVPIEIALQYTNYDFHVLCPPTGITCRTFIQYIGALAGCWARINRNGYFEFVCPSVDSNCNPVYVECYDGSNWSDFSASPNLYKIGGLKCKNNYCDIALGSQAETPDMHNIVADYSSNPFLIKGNFVIDFLESVNDVLMKTYNALEKWPSVCSYTMNWWGNPALDAGDLIKVTDRSGTEYCCLIAKNIYTYGGNCTVNHSICSYNVASISAQTEAMQSRVFDPINPSYAGLASYANNVYSVNLPGITSLTDGLAVVFKVDADCASPSLKIGSMDAKPIKFDTGDALDCHSGGIYEVRYNITTGNFIYNKGRRISGGTGGAGGNDGYTKLLLHFNGNFNDSSASAHMITNNGATIDTANKVFGSGSGYFNYGTDTSNQEYGLVIPASTDFNFGSEDFVIETRIRPLSSSNNWRNIYVQRSGEYSDYSLGIFLNKMSSITVEFTYDGYSVQQFSGLYYFTAGTWYHIAVIRSGKYVYILVDGNIISLKWVGTNAIWSSEAAVHIGEPVLNDGSLFYGNMDEFRISKGTSRWLSIVPPIQEYS